MENLSIDERWCLVHATHMDREEVEALARSGSVVCLCPSTEANLGDGFFRLPQWLQHDGRLAIGSDSHISINPFEELRWLEYGQRLVAEQRNIAAIRRPNTGRSLFEAAASGGALACGQNVGTLKAGAGADFVVLDDDSPMLIGHDNDSLLDALVFSGFSLPIDRVMSMGAWQVVEGAHRGEDEVLAEYSRVVGEIMSSVRDAS
jgi:formimidoylglutamate deiminase